MLVILLALGCFLLSPVTAEDGVNVYYGKCAEGGSVTEHVRRTSGGDYEVLNITVAFTDGTEIYATRPSERMQTILLCAGGNDISFCPHVKGAFGFDTKSCVSIDSQTGLVTNFTCNSHQDYSGGEPPGVSPGMDITEFTTDGVSFAVAAMELAPWSNVAWEDRYRFNGTSLITNNSQVIELNATQLQIQNRIKDAFVRSWSAVSFVSSGVLEHGPRGLHVTDGNGGSANLTDAAGVMLDTTSAPTKGNAAVTGVPALTVTLLLLLLLISATAASLRV